MLQKEISRQQFIESRDQVIQNLKILSDQMRSRVSEAEDHYRTMQDYQDTDDRLFRGRISVEGW